MLFDSDAPRDAVHLVMNDSLELIGTYSPHGFTLDGYDWLSAEHYVQAMKFAPGAHFMRIHDAPHPAMATRLGRAWFKRRRRDWKANRVTYMTRAMYTKCHAHAEVAARLLETGDRPIVECSTFEFFWGCGRDGRGENHFGKVLMRVRTKLREEGLGGVSNTPAEAPA